MKKTYMLGEFAEMLGIAPRTLQRWDGEGKLKAYRTKSNRRFYTAEQYEQYMQEAANQEEQLQEDIERNIWRTQYDEAFAIAYDEEYTRLVDDGLSGSIARVTARDNARQQAKNHADAAVSAYRRNDF